MFNSALRNKDMSDAVVFFFMQGSTRIDVNHMSDTYVWISFIGVIPWGNRYVHGANAALGDDAFGR